MKRPSCPAVTHSEFRQELCDRHCYRTGGKRTAAALSPSIGYHANVLRCVVQGGAKAWRGCYDRTAWEASSAAILLSVERLGGRLLIDGLSSLAALDGPCVIAANHMSALETHGLACILQPYRDVTFVVKRSLLSYPLFGAILRSLDAVAVSRSDPRADLKTLLTEGVRRLDAGISLILFPQARRRKVFNPAAFNSVAAKLAGRADVPLVPLALKTDFLARGFPVPDLGRVHPERDVIFSFGPAIKSRNREKEAHRESVAFITGRLRSWGAALAESSD